MDQTWGLKPELGVQKDLKPTVSFPQMSKEGHGAQRRKSLEASGICSGPSCEVVTQFSGNREKDIMIITKGDTQNHDWEASFQSVQFGFLTWVFLN